MGPPTLLQQTRQLLGRALRETGQALDRVGVKTAMLAVTPNDFYDDPVIYEDHLSRHRQQFPLLTAGRPVVHAQAAYVAPCATLIGSVRVGRGSSVWYGAVLRADACENAESFQKTDDEVLRFVTSNNIKNKEEDRALLPESNQHVDEEQPQQVLAEEETQQNEFEIEEDRYQRRLDRHGGGIYIGENTNVQDGCIVTARSNHCRLGSGVTIGHLAQIHSATVEDFCLIGMGSVINEGALIESESFIAAGAVVLAGQVVKSGELWVGNPARKIRDLTAEERKRLHFQSSEYVAVATGHREVMRLGGNISESMLKDYASHEDEAIVQSEKAIEQSEEAIEQSEEAIEQSVKAIEQSQVVAAVEKEHVPEPVSLQKEEARVG